LKLLRSMTIAATLLALMVVMLGAYTRLTDAGLGCPDWPGCYGRLVLPSAEKELATAQTQFPSIPIESKKAWTEMAHRYAAGTLGFLILSIVAGAWVLNRRGARVPWGVLPVLLTLLFFQAALGMWTVTLKLLPVVVMGHLLGGLLILASLSYFYWVLRTPRRGVYQGVCWINLGIVLVFIQIALGGWVSSNYAGLACVGFPRCNGLWLPHLDLLKGFDVFSPIGANYQGGRLDSDVRVTIQFIHRLGAIIVATYLIGLAHWLIHRATHSSLRVAARIVLLLILLQFGLGILNVVYFLPLWAAVAHNGVAALLLVSMVSLRQIALRGSYGN
jgi:cytochrome c oxidase assembly protein subunit 15